ncbi:hypothetical protein M404DRAFT_291068 [Pisolithus tinctorius Marx 270]|uniref:Uncharacterized protein n=1 Tax=Pisolithus tinctorius Marx 270 TaxID=870435 RepID=A0A0C3NL59_PISTI|nr:hypothetical protein M404DRAFT_291068 [Pisolithus tinctorius Marx 270]
MGQHAEDVRVFPDWARYVRMGGSQNRESRRRRTNLGYDTEFNGETQEGAFERLTKGHIVRGRRDRKGYLRGKAWRYRRWVEDGRVVSSGCSVSSSGSRLGCLSEWYLAVYGDASKTVGYGDEKQDK